MRRQFNRTLETMTATTIYSDPVPIKMRPKRPLSCMKKPVAELLAILVVIGFVFGASRVISVRFVQTYTPAPMYDRTLHELIFEGSGSADIRQLVRSRPDLLAQEQEGIGSALTTAVGFQKYEAAAVLVAEGWDPFLGSSPITMLAGRCAVELAIDDDDLRMLNILIGVETYGKLSRSEHRALTQWRDKDMTPEMRSYIDSRLEEY